MKKIKTLTFTTALLFTTQAIALEKSVTGTVQNSKLEGRFTSIDNSLDDLRGSIEDVITDHAADKAELEGKINNLQNQITTIRNAVKNPICPSNAVVSSGLCYYDGNKDKRIDSITDRKVTRSGSRSVCIDHNGYMYAYKSGNNLVVRVGQGHNHNCGTAWYNIATLPLSGTNASSTFTIKASAGCAGSASLSGSLSYIMNNKVKLSGTCGSPGAQWPKASVTASGYTKAMCPRGYIEDKNGSALKCFRYKYINTSKL